MLNLESLTIDEFRGLRNLRLDGLGRVNLLVGANDLGKTSILEAVAIYCRPDDLRMWVLVPWRHEGLDIENLEWIFPREAGHNGAAAWGRVRISGSGGLSKRVVEATYARTSRIQIREKLHATHREHDEYEQTGARVALTEVLEKSGKRNVSAATLEIWEGEPLEVPDAAGGLKVGAIVPGSHRMAQSAKLSQATLAGMKGQILDLLQEVDAEITNIQILSPRSRPAIYLEHSSAGLLPLSAFGDGVRRALLVALDLPATSGGVLLIDEIESSVHVSALGPMFSWIVAACERMDIQLFATTHSLEAVDAMLEAESGNLGRIVGYRLGRREGAIAAQRLDGDLLHRMRYERGLDVRL